MKKFIEKYPGLSAYLFFLVVSIFAYWQISFLQYSLQWDMLDAYLPWRYFAGDCIQNGQLPLWNPYQHLGYPIHADLRSSWFPEVFIIGLTSGYSNITIHFLFIFYLSIAGFGMYKLAQVFKTDAKVAVITGVAYILSGFFIGHGQDLGFIISASFIPWILTYYIKFVKNTEIKNLTILAILFLLMIFGAYPAFTIFLIYFLILIYIVSGFSCGIFSNKKIFLKSIRYHLLLTFIIIIGSSVLIITYMQVGPWVERFGGLVYEKASYNPFSPQSTLSWILPFGMVKNTSFFATDISMNNAYWGIIMLSFFVIGFIKKMRAIEWLFLTIGIFTLIASFGSYTPLHKILYEYVPGMNVFRMPSFFSLFTIITFLLLAGKGIQQFVDKPSKIRQLTNVILSLGVFILVSILVFSFIKADFSIIDFKTLISDFPKTFLKLGIYHHIIIHSIIQILILLVLIFLIRKKSLKKYLTRSILLLVLIEMIISVQLNMHFTGVNIHDPLTIRNNLKKKPDGFPLPPSKPINLNTEKASQFTPLWRNVNIFSKKPGFQGFNSFVLNNYDYLFDSLPLLKDAILENELVYLSDKIFPLSQISTIKNENYLSNYLFIDDSIYTEINSDNLLSSENDQISLNKFSPNEVHISYFSQFNQILTILQSDYIGWKAYLDGDPIDHFTSNILFKSIQAPPGNHEVVFRYENKPVRTGFYISYSVIIILLLTLLILYYKDLRMNNKKKTGFYILLIAIFGIIIIAVIRQFSLPSEENQTLKITEKLQTITSNYSKDNTIIFVNSAQKNLSEKVKEITGFKTESIYISNIKEIKTIKPNSTENLILINNNIEFYPELEEYILSKYPKKLSTSFFENSAIIVFSQSDFDKKEYLYYKTDSFSTNGNDSISDEPEPLWANPEGLNYKFDSQTIWGPGFSIFAADNITGKDIRVNMSCDVLFEEDTEAKFVVEIHRNLIRKSWFGGDIGQFVTDSGKWGKAVFCQPVNFQLEKDDMIKAYIWSMNKKSFSIDNLNVNITEVK